MKVFRILFVLLLVTGVFSTHNSTKYKHPMTLERTDLSDWFVMQRMYPDSIVDYEAYQKAVQQAMQMRSNVSRFASAASWQFAGPTNVGGRISDIEMHPST